MSISETSTPSGPPRPAVASRIHQVLALDPDGIALHFEDRTYPWSFFSTTARELDSALSTYGQARRIGIVLRNRPSSLAAALATISTGRQIVTLSPHLGDTGLADDVRALQPDVVIADEDDWARAEVATAVQEIGAVPLTSSDALGLHQRPTYTAPAPALLPAGDVAVLMMTSGTTGRPKHVALTFEQVASAFTAAGTDLSQEPRLRPGVAILWASLAHISGLYFAITHAVEGRPIALLERFEIEAWVALVRRHRPSYVRLPPAAIRMVLDSSLPRDTFDGVRAVGSGTAPLPPDLAEAFESRFGVPVLVKYGATEFAGAIAGWSLSDHRQWGQLKRGSVGRAHPGVQFRVVDTETGAELTSGSVGLLEARGGQLPTADGEWLRTTDLASLDDDGFLFIHGRSDDAINRGGFKIPPSVIEDVLREHPSVSDASAVGLPDERLGEVPVAAVTLRSEASEAELLSYLADRLTRYQMPVRILVLPELPRTASMKVSRPDVRTIALSHVPARGTS